METAVYIGCGTDVAPLLGLQHTIQKFVLVESQPASEFGHHVGKGLDRPHFFKEMRAALLTSGFSFSRRRDECNWIFVNRRTSAIVSLWISCPFPFKHAPLRLCEEIAQASTLICCGFFPHRSIVQWMKEPRCFVTDTKTVLGMEDEEDSVCAGDFSSWSLLLLPSKYWCKVWHDDEAPPCVDFWCLERFLRRHARELKRRRLLDQ